MRTCRPKGEPRRVPVASRWKRGLAARCAPSYSVPGPVGYARAAASTYPAGPVSWSAITPPPGRRDRWRLLACRSRRVSALRWWVSTPSIWGGRGVRGNDVGVEGGTEGERGGQEERTTEGLGEKRQAKKETRRSRKGLAGLDERDRPHTTHFQAAVMHEMYLGGGLACLDEGNRPHTRRISRRA